jgi:tetratricopeptide (TPR) repeat protein
MKMRRPTMTCWDRRTSWLPCFTGRTVFHPSPSRMRGSILAVILMHAFAASIAAAEPYTPASDDVVVETLPRPAGRRSGSAAAPANPTSAVAQATRDFEMARVSGDPRYLGHAQAALQSWWNVRTPAPAVALLRAQIHQHNHHFDAALADLDYVASRDPRSTQVHLIRAAIHQAQGRYDAAEQDCRRLALLAPPLATADCISRVVSHRGQARAAYDRLLTLRDTAGDIDSRQLREIELTLADIASRLGEEKARDHYRVALAAGVDGYALAAYADFLLDRQEFRAVLALPQQYADHPDLLLRAAIAARETADPQAPVLAERLRSQYAAHQRRGDFAPSREYARFLLRIEGDANAALAAALAAWRSQREPADARIVLEAAVASGRAGIAAGVIEHIESNNLEDVRLQALVRDARRLEKALTRTARSLNDALFLEEEGGGEGIPRARIAL